MRGRMRERDTFAPGAFHWCVNHVDLGEPIVSRLVRVICRDQIIWPEQLLGATSVPRQADSATHASSPLSTGPCREPNREPRFVYARRLLWRATYELTDLSVENIAELIGGYTPATVRPWAVSWKAFERVYGQWSEHHDGSRFNRWMRFGPHMIDLLGLEMPEEYLGWKDEPGDGLVPAKAAA